MNENSNSLGIFTDKVSLIACPSCDAELDVSEFEVFEDIDCPACGESLKVPERLGNFILIEELGRGAMGCVYLAMDESLNRLVALKVIRKEYGQDPKMLESVQREAQAMATLNHRNICQVYSFGRINEQPFFVMELLQGERLDEMMENGAQVDEIRALEITIDVAHGLEAAEQAGLTHGDIKPANLLMDEKGVAKVVDFGLAKVMEPGQEIEVWGTPYYIAPEKAKKKGEDSRSDQYSLGGTVFHALTGHPPFDGETPTKVVVAALKEETPLVRASNPEVSLKTEQVIQRMMAKSPTRRYPTYASLISDLELALQGAKNFRAEQARLAKLEEAKKNKKANPVVIIMSVLSAIVILGLGGYMFFQGRSGGGSAPLQTYQGPQREEFAPFQRAEERNLNQAVQALLSKDPAEARERMDVVKNLIERQTDLHVAMGWAKFFEAGMLLYAQEFDEAKALLEEVASTENMIFDTKGVPDEDPRLLAEIALGKAETRDLQRAARKSAPYFAHVGELAIGYRKLMSGDRNGSARHFRAYGEFSNPAMEWPYVLTPLFKGLHLPRTFDVPEAKKTPSGKEILKEMEKEQEPSATRSSQTSGEDILKGVVRGSAVKSSPSQRSSNQTAKAVLEINLPFEEGNGRKVKDLASRNDGRFEGAVSWTEGKVGNALSLGTSGESSRPQFVSLEKPVQVSSGSSWSLAAWIWIEKVNSASNGVIVQQKDDDKEFGRTWLGISKEGELTSFLGGDHSLSESKLDLKKWYHVAVTTGSGKIRLYVDGKVVSSRNGRIEPTLATFMIGNHKVPAVESQFHGKIDEFRLYKGLLSPQEVAKLASS